MLSICSYIQSIGLFVIIELFSIYSFAIKKKAYNMGTASVTDRFGKTSKLIFLEGGGRIAEGISVGV